LAVGTQAEKFLFYRGVANFDVPLTATVFGDESIRVSNRGKDAIPVVIAFTNRGGKIGYRVERNVSGSVTIPAPLLDRDVATLRQELASILAGEGLFAKEATAMVETWRDTWFEEGTRVFYVFPRATVDAVLPVTIWPKPANMARVFVGRMDVITPAMERDVAAAFKVNDATTLAKYGRVLGPIADRVLADTPLPAERAAISRILNSVLAAQARGGTVCP
ncbi:MAG TPA: hypothetical protein VE967_01765, partial [Gemmatimonadaceae bacterium]|nr:hypothetical protein [Gemmatimonadaceae bacterium]